MSCFRWDRYALEDASDGRPTDETGARRRRGRGGDGGRPRKRRPGRVLGRRAGFLDWKRRGRPGDATVSNRRRGVGAPERADFEGETERFPGGNRRLRGQAASRLSVGERPEQSNTADEVGAVGRRVIRRVGGRLGRAAAVRAADRGERPPANGRRPRPGERTGRLASIYRLAGVAASSS